MTWMISNRALVLHEMIRGIDGEIKAETGRGNDVTELRTERKRLADEAMIYLSRAVKVKRTRHTKAEYHG